jgi:hypothetical protein
MFDKSMKSLKNLLVFSLAVVGFLLAGTAAKADPLALNLDSPNQSGIDGQTLTFYGNITNDSSGTIYLNSDSYNVDLPLTLDDSGFVNNAPLSLDPGASSGDIELFAVTIPLGTANGLYLGNSFEILGGDPSDNTDVVGSAEFSVNVNNAPTGEGNSTPEPSSLVLLLTGMAVLAGTLRRRLIE